MSFGNIRGASPEFRSGRWSIRDIWSGLPNFVSISATGGTVTTLSYNGVQYKVHVFLSNGTFSVSDAGSLRRADFMVIAGGGGGGTASTGSGGDQRTGGGGGAGGYRSSYRGFGNEFSGGNSVLETPLILESSTDYNITVGSGGITDAAGQNSSIVGGSVNIVSIGGGLGGFSSRSQHLGTFGSAGGGGRQDRPTDPRPQRTVGQGTLGGFGLLVNTANNAGGGGGGAKDEGVTGFASTTLRNKGGDGGIGFGATIRDNNTTYYAGGGGGGVTANEDRGFGGYLSGGNGGVATNTNGSGQAGFPGVVNTGGGGGGAGMNTGTRAGGAGGSGIVIIRYPLFLTYTEAY